MIKKQIVYLLLSIFLFSCKKENRLDCFKSNGPEINEVRYPGNFNTIEIGNKIDLNVQQGPDFKVEVHAGKHIIKNITTKISNETLSVENINTCNFVRGYKKTISVTVTLPYLKFLKNNGVGTVRFAEDYQQDTLVVRIESSGDIYINGSYKQIRTSSHGNGDIYLHGTANSFYVYTNGTNFIHADELLVKDYAFIETLSIGDCYLNASMLQEFNYNIGSQGNIYYSGNPPHVSGILGDQAKGRVIKE